MPWLASCSSWCDPYLDSDIVFCITGLPNYSLVWVKSLAKSIQELTLLIFVKTKSLCRAKCVEHPANRQIFAIPLYPVRYIKGNVNILQQCICFELDSDLCLKRISSLNGKDVQDMPLVTMLSEKLSNSVLIRFRSECSHSPTIQIYFSILVYCFVIFQTRNMENDYIIRWLVFI